MRAPAETVEWLRGYYAAMDSQAFDDVAGYLAEDIHTCYPNGMQVDGRDALMKLSERTLATLERIRHEIVNVWVEGDELIFELEVTYWRKDGVEISRGGIGIFVMRDGLVGEQRLFVDFTGVWE